LSGYGNDYGNQGQLLARTSQEALVAKNATPISEERRHRKAGWWPDAGTVVKAVLIGFLVIVAIGWGLTLLN
jgi:hypothetical protein